MINRTYEQGFNDAMKCKNGIDSTTMLMCYSIGDIAEIIHDYEMNKDKTFKDKSYVEKQMPVEFNGTKEEAIKNCCHGLAYPQAFTQALEALGLIKFKEKEKKYLFKNDDITLEWCDQENAYRLYHRGVAHWLAK